MTGPRPAGNARSDRYNPARSRANPSPSERCSAGKGFPAQEDKAHQGEGSPGWAFCSGASPESLRTLTPPRGRETGSDRPR
jgi:hypothetical protein